MNILLDMIKNNRKVLECSRRFQKMRVKNVIDH